MSRTVFVRFLILAAAMAALAALAGYFLASRAGAGRAALIGCLIALAGSIAGALPVLAAYERPHHDRLPAIFIAMAVRLCVVVVLALAVAAFGLLPVRPLLVWAAICHAALLVPDSLLAIRLVARETAD